MAAAESPCRNRPETAPHQGNARARPVSAESATHSRLIRLARMPSVPIEIPSVTTMVLKSTGVPPAA